MEGGRAPASGSPPSPWRRRVRWTLGVLLGLALLPCLLAPLLLRGFLLRWVVARATRELCGAFQVDDGRLGWTFVPDLLLGRPFTLELRGVRVAAPDGGEALTAERVSGRVDVRREPWRIVVDEAIIARARWRLAVGGAPGSGLLDALRAVPTGATRAICFPPAVSRASARDAAPASSTPSSTRASSTRASSTRTSWATGSLVVRDVQLDDVDVDLDFPAWGLALPHVRAEGSLGVGPREGNGLLFDVRDARAPGGRLRVGPGGAAATGATTTALFDDVVITRVGVTADRPADLVLAVDHAATGRSRLAGTAVFENVVGPPAVMRAPPGLSLDARWERTTDAVQRLEAPWLPRDALGELLDGAIAARVRGPFRALSGALSIEGPRVRIAATLERGARATLDARADAVDLTPMLDASLVPLVGGRVTGRLRADLTLVAGLGDVDVTIPEADLSLTRPSGPAPRRLVFLVGAPAREGAAGAGTDGETLALALSSARLRRRALRLEGLRARWADLSASGALTLALPPRAAAPATPARLDAKLVLGVASLARWVAPTTVSGRLTATAEVAGPLDHLRAHLVFGPSTTASILGERFTATAPTTVTLDDGQVLTLERLALAHVGGGTLESRGRVARAGPIAGELRVTGYPLAQLPGLTRAPVPRALAPRPGASFGDALAGTLDATWKIGGTAAQPRVSGRLALTDVRLAGRRLGDGHFDASARGETLTLAGTLGDALSVNGTATRRPNGLAADAELKLRAFALGPWLPPPFTGLDVAASGEARVSVAPARPTAGRADVRLTGLGSALDVRANAAGERVTGDLHGVIALAGLRPLWQRDLADADGDLDVALATAPGTALTGMAPGSALTGSVRVARALSVQPNGWPLAIGVATGGRVDVDGTRLRSPGLDLTTDGATAHLSGEVRLDADAPARSIVALSATGRVDAAVLARRLRPPGLASAAGTLTLDARATGEARAPVATGEARFDELELAPAAAGWPRVRVSGTVAARAHALSTRALRVETVGAGAVTVGRADAPASVDVSSWWPLRLGRVDVPVAGRGLHVGDAARGLEIGALDLHLRLSGDAAVALLLAGDVDIARARYDPKPAKGPPSSRAWYEALPPRLTIDLTLRGPDDAVVVGVRHLPDVTVGFECRVRASARAGTLSGGLRGDGAYSRFALSLYHLFVERGPVDVRRCRPFRE